MISEQFASAGPMALPREALMAEGAQLLCSLCRLGLEGLPGPWTVCVLSPGLDTGMHFLSPSCHLSCLSSSRLCPFLLPPDSGLSSVLCSASALPCPSPSHTVLTSKRHPTPPGLLYP